MTVANTGAVTLTGKLADGTAFTAGSWLDGNYNWWYGNQPYSNSTQTFPVYANIYTSPAGYFYGEMVFEDEPGISDLDGSMVWYKPQQTTAQVFNGGFNLEPTMIGSAYTTPTSDFLLDMDSLGDAAITFSAGNLTTSATNSITVGVAPSAPVAVTSNATDKLTMSCTASAGSFTGKFLAPGTVSTMDSFSGVFFQKQNLGAGQFVGTTQSGNVMLVPQMIATPSDLRR